MIKIYLKPVFLENNAYLIFDNLSTIYSKWYKYTHMYFKQLNCKPSPLMLVIKILVNQCSDYPQKDFGTLNDSRFWLLPWLDLGLWLWSWNSPPQRLNNAHHEGWGGTWAGNKTTVASTESRAEDWVGQKNMLESMKNGILLFLLLCTCNSELSIWLLFPNICVQDFSQARMTSFFHSDGNLSRNSWRWFCLPLELQSLIPTTDPDEILSLQREMQGIR